MPRRTFLPPATCDSCHERPALGDTLWHSGVAWLCPACLAQETPGHDLVSKCAEHAIQMEKAHSLSKRAKIAGDIESAIEHERTARHHGHALGSIQDLGQRQALTSLLGSGEVVPEKDSWLKDTLADPNLAAIDASRMRGQLLEANEVTALAIDVSQTTEASNSVEKLLAHELALAHKIAFDQANRASLERDPKMEIKRLQLAARMMTTAQEAAVTLQKIKGGGTHNLVVQHVHVEAGGQAVVGNVRSERSN